MEVRVRSHLHRGLILAMAIAVVGLGAHGALAQTSEYTIGIGDELDISVWQRPDLGGRVTVDSEGNVMLPLVGSIHAVGQTPGRLGADLQRRFSFVDREVNQVSVSVAEYSSRRVFVVGEVLKPGAYSFPEIPGVWEVLREAGGPTASAALNRVRVIPPPGRGTPVLVDVEHALASGDFSGLPTLQSGTTLFLYRMDGGVMAGDAVHVYGEVGKPGRVSIDEARTIVQAVLAAGGPSEEADVSAVRVVRPGPVRARVFQVDLNDYVEDGILFANLSLLPGDTITVPKSQSRTVWRAAREVGRITGDVLGTVLFFTRWGDDDKTSTTSITIDPGTATASP
ncbi:polysaccharide export protein [bacterium]|nr:polysaccharide export protein [bacterium]